MSPQGRPAVFSAGRGGPEGARSRPCRTDAERPCVRGLNEGLKCTCSSLFRLPRLLLSEELKKYVTAFSDEWFKPTPKEVKKSMTSQNLIAESNAQPGLFRAADVSRRFCLRSWKFPFVHGVVAWVCSLTSCTISRCIPCTEPLRGPGPAPGTREVRIE